MKEWDKAREEIAEFLFILDKPTEWLGGWFWSGEDKRVKESYHKRADLLMAKDWFLVKAEDQSLPKHPYHSNTIHKSFRVDSFLQANKICSMITGCG